MNKVEIRPQPRQTTFLSNSADIVIYGGAAGGGKSYALLLEPLRHIHNPEFGAVIFRRTMPEITKEGGMWDEASKLYPLIGGEPNKNEYKYTFRAGARISFAHLQYETTLDNWRGAQIPLIEFDQLETFTRRQFFYMLSRNRSTSGIRPYMRATANPEPGWLADLLGWWIADDGYANLDRVGKIRWFIVVNDQIIWADDPNELIRQHPDSLPKSMTFIVSTVFDNQILLSKDPGYLANLQALPLIDRERLLGDHQRGGNWKIKPTAGKVFNRSWFKTVPAAPNGGVTVRFWDFAATEKELAKDDPDYSASVLMRFAQGGYYILDCTAEQLSPAGVDREFVNQAWQDASRCQLDQSEYHLRWEVEPGSAGKREARRMAMMVAGIDARGESAVGDKLLRAKPLAAQTEAGNVYIVAGAWNEPFLNHMHGQPELAHDDIMDAAAGAFRDLAGMETDKPATVASRSVSAESIFGG